MTGGDGETTDLLRWRPLGSDWTPAQYPHDRMMEEAAFIAYHFHWDLEQILSFEHGERRRWAREISRINEEINEQSGALVARAD